MKKYLCILFVFVSSFLFSQRPNKTIRDTTFEVNDLISIPFPGFCLGRGCYDGISPETYDSLTIVASFMKKYSQFIFQIETNTDQRGDSKANKKLSGDRASFLRSILIKRNGIDSTSLFAKGFGETNPIRSQKEIDLAKSKEEKENLYTQNRRTVLHIIGKK